jgi:hypothetical protein
VLSDPVNQTNFENINPENGNDLNHKQRLKRGFPHCDSPREIDVVWAKITASQRFDRQEEPEKSPFAAKAE